MRIPYQIYQCPDVDRVRQKIEEQTRYDGVQTWRLHSIIPPAGENGGGWFMVVFELKEAPPPPRPPLRFQWPFRWPFTRNARRLYL